MLESPIPRSRSEPPQPLLRPRRLQRRQPRLLRRDQEQLELIGADAEAITVRDHDVIVVVALLGPAVPAQERIFAVGIDALADRVDQPFVGHDRPYLLRPDAEMIAGVRRALLRDSLIPLEEAKLRTEIGRA